MEQSYNYEFLDLVPLQNPILVAADVFHRAFPQKGFCLTPRIDVPQRPSPIVSQRPSPIEPPPSDDAGAHEAMKTLTLKDMQQTMRGADVPSTTPLSDKHIPRPNSSSC